MALKTMVMVSFCGLRRDDFRAGRAVLPKHFLEDVGLEAFQLLKRTSRRVCVSNMPKVMVEGFLKEYLHVEEVVGRELKVVGGYYIGLMEEEKEWRMNLDHMFGKEKMDGDVVSIGNFNFSLRHHLKVLFIFRFQKCYTCMHAKIQILSWFQHIFLTKEDNFFVSRLRTFMHWPLDLSWTDISIFQPYFWLRIFSNMEIEIL